MTLKSIFFADDHDELTTQDAVRIAVESIAIGLFLAAAFGPFEYSFWGLMVKAAVAFGVAP